MLPSPLVEAKEEGYSRGSPLGMHYRQAKWTEPSLYFLSVINQDLSSFYQLFHDLNLHCFLEVSLGFSTLIFGWKVNILKKEKTGRGSRETTRFTLTVTKGWSCIQVLDFDYFQLLKRPNLQTHLFSKFICRTPWILDFIYLHVCGWISLLKLCRFGICTYWMYSSTSKNFCRNGRKLKEVYPLIHP